MENKQYSPALGFYIHRVGKITTISGMQFVKVEEVIKILLPSEYRPFYSTIYIPCTWIDTNYAEYNGALKIDDGEMEVWYDGNKRTNGWIRICASFVNNS